MSVGSLAVVIVLVLVIIVFTHIRADVNPERFSIDPNYNLRDITGISLSGAGNLGYALLGAVEELQRSGLDISKVRYFAGTSAGAIIAVFLACRIPIANIKKFVINLDVQHMFADQNDGIRNRFKRKSIFDGSKMESSIEDFLREHTGIPKITLQQIYEVYGSTIILATVDIKHPQEPIYLSHTNYPNLPAAKAARASSSIPLVFDPVYHEDKIFVDGGVLDIFPIKELQKHIPLSRITGVSMDNDIKYIDEDWKKLPYYTGLNAKMFRRRFSRNRLTRDELRRVVFISFHDKGREYSAINFNMTDDIKNVVYQMGVDSARNFLHGSEFHI